VRRPSGGLALVHHHEVTYALALPAGAAWQPGGESWLVGMHEAVRVALSDLGVESRLCEGPQARGEVLCFLSHTTGDVLVGGCKVVGSAQRKGRGALMQHGSILLRQSPHTPALPGIAELTGRVIEVEELIAAVIGVLSRRCGWVIESGWWSEREERLAEELQASRYGASGWNERR
jgi:lipoate-protein ligase A